MDSLTRLQDVFRSIFQFELADLDFFNPTGEINEAFLAVHPTLPLHTKHFERDFLRRLLEALPFADLDEATGGLVSCDDGEEHRLRMAAICQIPAATGFPVWGPSTPWSRAVIQTRHHRWSSEPSYAPSCQPGSSPSPC